MFVEGAIDHLLHEIIRHADRDVEVGELIAAELGGDEVEDVRVVYVQDAHVGPSATAALLNLLRGHVEQLHEAHRPCGHASRAVHRCTLRP